MLLALGLFAGASLLPARPRDLFVAGVAAVERRTGFVAVLSFGLFIYWLARLLFAPAEFTRMLTR